jgi:LmbE family N-acetylglucosaminyl deacetylase
MSDKVSVVIPAHNEAATVGQVVSALLVSEAVDEVIVVDNSSSDGTATVAAGAGARVIHVAELGYGRAMKAGMLAARNTLIFKLDGDMRNPSREWLERHLRSLTKEVGLVKAYWDSSEDPMPVTKLVVKPALKIFFPSLSEIIMPISGIYLVRSDFLKIDDMPDDYSFDLDVLIRATRSPYLVEQTYLGEVLDKLKPVAHYVPMATQLLRHIQCQGEIERGTPTMLLMAHPDDAEIWCGGSLIKILSAGAPVKLWILTSSDNRAAEAQALAKIYPNLAVDFVGSTEFYPYPQAEAVNRLAADITALRPKVLISHHHGDAHPDHRACYELLTGACFRTDRGFLPQSIYMCNSYFQSQRNFAPDTFIDISEEAELKYRAIGLHQSQDVNHWVSMARKMDALNGAKCGVKYAEAFELVNLYQSPRSRSLW